MTTPQSDWKWRGGLFLPHIVAGRIADRRIPAFRGADRRRGHPLRARMFLEPVLPYRPPRPLHGRRRVEPLLGAKGVALVRPGAHAMSPARMHRAADDAGVVPARGQQESVVRRAREPTNLVHRLPRSDMIG